MQASFLRFTHEHYAAIPQLSTNPYTITARVMAALSAPAGFEVVQVPVRSLRWPEVNTIVRVSIRKDPWEAIKEAFLSSPDLAPHLHWSFEPTSVQRERVYGEPWTGDAWRDIERSLPIAHRPLMLILSSDGADVKGRSVHPVYVLPANLPLHLRRTTPPLVLAYLSTVPIISGTSIEKATEARRLLFHGVMAHLLGESTTPAVRTCGSALASSSVSSRLC